MKHTSFASSSFVLHFFAQFLVCFLYASFMHASCQKNVVDYTFYCEDTESKTKTYRVYLAYFSQEDTINLGFIRSEEIIGLDTKTFYYDGKTIFIKELNHSQENLDLLLTPLTIRLAKKENNDLLFFNYFNNCTVDELVFIQKWYKSLSINNFLLQKVMLHIKDKGGLDSTKDFDNRSHPSYHNLYYEKLLQYKRNNNKNKQTFNIGCLSGLYNDAEHLPSLHEYLHETEELDSAENVKTLLLNAYSLRALDGKFIKKVRRSFIKLTTLHFLNYENLKISRDYCTFKNMLYDEENNFKPLTFYVNDADQARKKIQHNVLFFYKYSTLVPLFELYLSLNPLITIGEMSILLHFIDLLGSLSFVAPCISFIAGTMINKGGGGYPKEGYDSKGYKIKSNAIINSTDLLWIVPMIVHLCYLIQVCYLINQKIVCNVSFKTLLINRMYIVGLLMSLNTLKGLQDERLVYAILRNKNTIFKPVNESLQEPKNNLILSL